MTGRPTLRDVAGESGVVFSTVSRILRGQTDGYRPETVARVQEAAARVGYRPNVQAQALRLRRHQTIAILVPDLDNFGFIEVLRGIQETCTERGYKMLISEVRAPVDGQWSAPQLEGVVDGALVAYAVVDNMDLDTYLGQVSVPAVFVQRGVPGAPSAVLDEAHNVALMLDHLTDLGHTQIAHVSGSLHTDTGVRRSNAFEQLMNDHGLAVRPEWRSDGDFTFHGGARALDQILEAPTLPTAIAVDSLMSALSVLVGLSRRGVNVPTDISVIAIDEHVVAQQTTPPLTTIKVPQRALGHAATQMLLDVINGGEGGTVTIEERSQLILRESTGAPRAHDLPGAG